MGIQTDAIHGGKIDDPFGSIQTPIYQTCTYAQEYPGEDKGYCYTRTGNPTRDSLQKSLAELEKGTDAFVFATGIAAENAVLQQFLSPGDKIVVPRDLYGGTHRLLHNVYAKWGVRVERADFTNLSDVAEKVRGAQIVWAETPTNPRLEVYDLPAIARIVKRFSGGAYFVVDNTFATPLTHQPLTFGADIVIHSVTKYLSGHSDLVLGAAITRNSEIAEGLKFIQNGTGTGAAPYECWLAQRGIRTFPLRFKQHCANALEVARWLEKQPEISKVYFPGLESHDTFAIAERQFKGLYGGVVSIELKGNVETAKTFVSRLKIFHLAESLGGVKSLACHPASMTHAAVPAEERKKIGLSDGLIRLSCGIEDVEDLITDVKVALRSVRVEIDAIARGKRRVRSKKTEVNADSSVEIASA